MPRHPTRGIRIADSEWAILKEEAAAWEKTPSQFAREGLWVYTLLARLTRETDFGTAADLIIAAYRTGRGTVLQVLIDEQLELMREERDGS